VLLGGADGQAEAPVGEPLAAAGLEHACRRAERIVPMTYASSDLEAESKGD
jgi:hypothetical protein